MHALDRSQIRFRYTRAVSFVEMEMEPALRLYLTGCDAAMMCPVHSGSLWFTRFYDLMIFEFVFIRSNFYSTHRCIVCSHSCPDMKLCLCIVCSYVQLRFSVTRRGAKDRPIRGGVSKSLLARQFRDPVLSLPASGHRASRDICNHHAQHRLAQKHRQGQEEEETDDQRRG